MFLYVAFSKLYFPDISQENYYLICVSAHDKILISLLHKIQYRVNNSMTQGRIHEEEVKLLKYFTLDLPIRT